MTSRLLIRHLPFFTVAAEEENFLRAAHRLHVTQPALSRRMQDLEAGLGVKLFERSKGRVHLTAEGQQFSLESRRLMDSFEGAVRELQRAASALPQSLTVGFNEHAMRISSLTAALRIFRDKNPDVSLTISIMSSAAQLAAIRNGQLDVAVLYLSEDDLTTVDSREIVQHDPYVVAIPDTHPMADAPTLQIRNLAGEELIWPSNDASPALFADLQRAWRASGVDPHVTIEIASAEAALNAVSAGLGVAVVRSSNAGREPPGVILRTVSDLQVTTNVRVAWSRSDVSAATREFLKLLNAKGVAVSAA